MSKPAEKVLGKTPIMITCGHAQGLWCIDTDINPEWSHHVWVDTKELEEMQNVLKQYDKLMDRLEELRKHEKEPTEF